MWESRIEGGENSYQMRNFEILSVGIYYGWRLFHMRRSTLVSLGIVFLKSFFWRSLVCKGISIMASNKLLVCLWGNCKVVVVVTRRLCCVSRFCEVVILRWRRWSYHGKPCVASAEWFSCPSRVECCIAWLIVACWIIGLITSVIEYVRVDLLISFQTIQFLCLRMSWCVMPFPMTIRLESLS